MKEKINKLNAEQILRLVLDTIPIRIFWKDKDSTFLGGNQAFIEDLKLKPDDKLAGKKDSDFFKDPILLNNFRSEDKQVMDSGQPKIAIEELLAVPGQADKWLKINKIPMTDKGQVVGILATYEDITEQVEYRNQIEQQAMVDPLTGIANRRKLQKLIDGFAGEYAGLLFIDLDYFKAVNDSLGHTIGDVLLKEVAMRLDTLSHNSDILVARLGGDEFSIFVPFKSVEQVQESLELLARNTIKILLEPFNIGHHILSVGASIGVTVIDRSLGANANGFREADMAMYFAKERGRNNYQFYDESMRQDADRKNLLGFYLRSALEKNELSLLYQPQFNQHEEIIGAEALLRWHNGELGEVPPEQFISLAEETGLIHDIGDWVLNTSLDALKSWQSILDKNPEFKLAVNFSSKQFQNIKLPDIITSALKSRNIAPQNLQVEITESVLIDYQDRALQSMLKMQKTGISIAIDDFGTGYSSLSYLTALPIDKLKIDRSFVTELHKKSTNRKLVETIINMSKNLQMDVIAEGVLTIEEKHALIDLGCFQFQGFYFSEPIASDVLAAKYAS